MTPPSATRGRWALLFGLGLAIGPVLGTRSDLALDTANSPSGWTRFVSLCVLAGAVPGVIAGARTERGNRGERPVALLGSVAAVAFIVLFNTGDTTAVSVLVGLGTAMSTAAFVAAASLTSMTDPGISSGRDSTVINSAHNAAAALAGVAAGSLVMFVDPSWPWATVSSAGGVVALGGAAVGILRPRAAPPHGRSGLGSAGDATTSVVSSISAGLILAVPLRIGPFLADEFGTGVRYELLTLALGAAGGASLAVALAWHGSRQPTLREVERIAAALCVTAAVGALFAAASETLPGVIIGVGLAVATAAGAAALLCGINPAVRSSYALVVAWGLAVLSWPNVADAIGSDRWTMAVFALPALIIGAGGSRAPARTSASTAPPEPISTGTADSSVQPLLSARGVEFSYGGVQVLFGVDLDVRSDEIVALVGANGAGKTTFLRNLAGLEQPSSGVMMFGGEDLSEFTPDQRVELGVNLIAGGSAVAEDLTVAENLSMYGFSLTARDRNARIRLAYEQFPRLAERKGQRGALLSGGERQMLALAKALILRPRLLVIDELSLGLAPIIVGDLIEVVRQIHREGTAVLLVEQSVNVALELADRAYCMEKGAIVFESTSEALRDDEGLLESVYLEGVAAALEHRGGVTA